MGIFAYLQDNPAGASGTLAVPLLSHVAENTNMFSIVEFIVGIFSLKSLSISNSGRARRVTASSTWVISAMDATQMKGVSRGKTSEGNAAQDRANSPNNDSFEDGYSGDRVSYMC